MTHKQNAKPDWPEGCEDFNSVRLIGSVATEPELQQLPDGDVRLRFMLYVPRPGSSNTSEQGVDLIRVAEHGPQATAHAQNLKKGDWVCVEGRLETRPRYDNVLGRYRNHLEVCASLIERRVLGSAQHSE